MHEVGSVGPLGLVLIVSPTTETEILDGCLTTPGNWLDVVELELPGGWASATGGAMEGAAATVTLPNRSSYGSWNLSRTCERPPRDSRTVGSRELPLLELLNTQSEDSLENSREIVGIHGVAHQVLRIQEEIVRSLVDRHLKSEPLRGDGLNGLGRNLTWAWFPESYPPRGG